jgi:hypothetical protein
MNNTNTAALETANTYAERQAKLAASPAGAVAVQMTPGTRWVTPKGIEMIVWKGWVPDVDGHAEEAATKYRWGFDRINHNTEIGFTGPRGQVVRVAVKDVANWRPVKAA